MPPSPTLDVAFARSHFPALDDSWAFFENAGGSYVPKQVIDRVVAYMTESQVQPGGPFPSSVLAAERQAEGQRLIAETINADTDEVLVGASTTENVYMVSHAIRPWFREGDEIFVTNQDHEANGGAWRRFAEHGIAVKEWQVDPETGELSRENLASLLTERTRLVCFPHCANLNGTMNDVGAVARQVHDAGGLVFVDGVAAVPHKAIDVKALDVDFYAFSPYKMFGPHVGIVYGKRDLWLKAEGQNHPFIGAEEVPLKIAAGYPNHELTAGLAGTAEYFEALYRHHFEAPANSLNERVRRVYELFAAHETAIASRLVDYLKGHPKVRLHGRATGDAGLRAPTIAFSLPGRRCEEIPQLMLPHRVAIKNGSFYARRYAAAIGLDPADGVVRASMVHYTSLEDVDRLIAALDAVL